MPIGYSSDIGFYGGALPSFGASPLQSILATRQFFPGFAQPAMPQVSSQDLMSTLFGGLPSSLLKPELKEKVEAFSKELQGLDASQQASRLREFAAEIGAVPSVQAQELALQPDILSSPLLEAPSLEEVVKQQLSAEEKSPLWDLLSTFGEEGALREIQALFSGEETGALSAAIADTTTPAEEVDKAVAAQLFKGLGPVKLASGDIFNPYSMDLQDLTREFQLPQELKGQQLTTFGLGMLSKYDLGLTKERIGLLQRGVETGGTRSYGGSKGYRVMDPLLQLGQRLGEGEEISQATRYRSKDIAWALDQVYGGRAGGGFGRGFASLLSTLA